MKILFIAHRSYGDAAILRSVLDRICKSDDITIDVVTLPEQKNIFNGCKNVRKIFTAYLFKISRHKKLCLLVPRSIQTYLNIRYCQHYDYIVDWTGDKRERRLGYDLKSRNTIFMSVEREESHPFNTHITREGYQYVDKTLHIGKECLNIYSQMQKIMESLGLYVSDVRKVQCVDKPKITVGIHPFASMKCRMWQWDRWRNVIGSILYKYAWGGGKDILFSKGAEIT